MLLWKAWWAELRTTVNPVGNHKIMVAPMCEVVWFFFSCIHQFRDFRELAERLIYPGEVPPPHPHT